jgi:hypothetical protein
VEKWQASQHRHFPFLPFSTFDSGFGFDCAPFFRIFLDSWKPNWTGFVWKDLFLESRLLAVLPFFYFGNRRYVWKLGEEGFAEANFATAFCSSRIVWESRIFQFLIEAQNVLNGFSGKYLFLDLTVTSLFLFLE